MSLAVRAGVTVVKVLRWFRAADRARAAGGVAVMRMPQTTEERADDLQGNRQGGNEATVVREEGEHAKPIISVMRTAVK